MVSYCLFIPIYECFLRDRHKRTIKMKSSLFSHLKPQRKTHQSNSVELFSIPTQYLIAGSQSNTMKFKNLNEKTKSVIIFLTKMIHGVTETWEWQWIIPPMAIILPEQKQKYYFYRKIMIMQFLLEKKGYITYLTILNSLIGPISSTQRDKYVRAIAPSLLIWKTRLEQAKRERDRGRGREHGR